jgi:phosphoglycolate phosphatase-like HAD superfamily hydrolase
MHICLFDIDGTLVSSGGAGSAAMECAVAEEFGVPPSPQRVSYSGRTDRAIGNDLLRVHGLDETPENWHRLRAGYLHRLPTFLQSHQGKVLPGIAELLRQLAGRSDVIIGLLTGNIRDGARLKLGHFGLFDYFAFGGFGDHHFDRDDVAREALEVAQRHCNGSVCLDRIWVIGDTPLDVRCARCIGARVVAVGTGWHPLADLAAAAPDLLLTDFSDPAPFLALWDRGESGENARTAAGPQLN